MSEVDLKIDFLSFKLATIITCILIVLNITGVISTSIWITLLPIIVVIIAWFFIIFLIGLLTILMVAKKMADDEENGDNQEETS